MTGADLLPATVLKRKAVVYVRQSTQTQVQINLESQRRQYELVDEARRRGFRDVEVIDDDLGRSASGTMARPGFDRLVAWLCAGDVGAVLCFDASRLARNGRDWHHLLELCGLVGARVIDLDGVYDPCRPNDRLLLGMKAHSRVGNRRPARPHVRRSAIQGAARRAADQRACRLRLGPRDGPRLRPRYAAPGGDPSHLCEVPGTGQRAASSLVPCGGSAPFSSTVRRQANDRLRLDAYPLS